ncbi:hypothetical protein [Carbonactinospora thermoautotrophica]|uniref:hypothetical protein n=1 Tax=Carbonactinospora thermoautotrophica TaxID=1469144 RepID=UPI0008330890|nr:hypothetical protein [Carbonactinospora thermoautotrophica]
MNRYGVMAKQHWERWLPQRYQQIPPAERESFFTRLGEEVEVEIAELWPELAGEDPPGESYQDKQGRLNMARKQAEERVLAERVLLAPETPEVLEETPAPGGEEIPLVARPGTPEWERIVAEKEALGLE